ncbi:MAG: VWA domain-containing protein [Abitibacteriaceae bacterium]|nr:VWA domain-containing protein [Abditibacteriaceae bacterium]
MFELELTWNRAAHTGKYARPHVLRVRAIPTNKDGQIGLPIRMGIAVDTSGSMEGEKLEYAKRACLTIADQIRPQDRLWLCSFDSQIAPLFNGVAGGGATSSSLAKSISGLQASGVTRTDYALDWLSRSVPVEPGTVRVGILITDGHPTDAKGTLIGNLVPLVDQAHQLGLQGLSLSTVGLGKASDFNTSFLIDLCNRGHGTFIYADMPDKLEPQLRECLLAAQAMSSSDAYLLVKPLYEDVKPIAFCRVRPDFVPLDSPTNNCPVQLGALRGNTPTDILMEVEIPPLRFGESTGQRDVLQVRLESQGLWQADAIASIHYTTSFTESQKINKEVDQDRLMWEINIHTDELSRTNDDDANRTGELLADIHHKAAQAGFSSTADQAAQALGELQKSGKLDAHTTAVLVSNTRATGDLT